VAKRAQRYRERRYFMNSPDKHKLSIVIPAYNEEEAIAAIIERSLAGRNIIIETSPVSSVEIIVVNDGSQDQTAQIASQYKDIKLITYAKNRGYGAAIKTGFENATGDILGFLDADGTCDPEFFAQLCKILIEENADIAIGSRMNPMSQMPKVRKLGNWLFAKMLSFFGNTKITDSASGMRVIRRSSLKRIYPLPDGLHFTPAMSARAVLDRNTKIVEKPMPYEERTGRSKLSVIRDGVRFLRVIFNTALTHRPFKLFGAISILFLAIAFLYGIQPTIQYIANRRIAEYMIYRFITILTLTLAGINLATLGVLSDHIVALINDYEPRHGTKLGRFFGRFLFSKLPYISILSILGGILLNAKTIYQYVTTGHIYVHWIYVLTGALLVLTGIELGAFSILRKIILLLKEKWDFERKYDAHE
jgi:glycosyltransferase involved in cell wall biosynthesis